jgi:predicted glycoside hydrolase/deacetylase ChbG (UPF0249 family)
MTADDWGFSPATNAGILELARLGVVRRVSILSTFAFVREDIEKLKSQSHLSLGLHFNLTDLEIRRSPLKILNDWIWGGRRAKKFVRDAFEAQLLAIRNLDIKVQHLDGHEHIHLLPGFLKDVAGLCRSAGIQQIRVPLDWSLLLRVQAPIVPLSLWARKDIRSLGFEALKFSYPSARIFSDRRRLVSYLAKREGHEIIIHPAKSVDTHLKQYDRRFLSERVEQYEALKAIAEQK